MTSRYYSYVGHKVGFLALVTVSYDYLTTLPQLTKVRGHESVPDLNVNTLTHSHHYNMFYLIVVTQK